MELISRMRMMSLELRLAAATLIALREGLPSVHRKAKERRSCIVLPEIVPLPPHKAAERLAARPKPLVCYAFCALGIMTVGWWDARLTPERFEDYLESRRERVEYLRARSGEKGEPASFLLHSSQDESLVLTIDELTAWYESYQLEFVDACMRTPNAETRKQGVSGVLLYGPPDDTEISGQAFEQE